MQITRFSEAAGKAQFVLKFKGATWGKVLWTLPGLFNARNAAAALLAAGLIHKPEDPFCAIEPEWLNTAKGVRRRQEIRHHSPGLLLIEDFGHHPSAIRGVLASLRQHHPEFQLCACFEPRSNTAASHHFQEAFAQALTDADRVWIAPVHRAKTIPPQERLDTVRLAQEVNNGQAPATLEALKTDLLEHLANCRRTHQPVLVVFFSNGSFGGLIEEASQWASSEG